MSDTNSTTSTELHQGIAGSVFNDLYGATSGSDFAIKFANSGLTLAQAETEVSGTQAQEILSKFGNDSDFQDLLNGHAGIAQTTFDSLINAASGKDFAAKFATSGLTLAQAENEINHSQTQEVLNKFDNDADFHAFLNGQNPTQVTVVGVSSHDTQAESHGTQNDG